jgi:hypothetical protein
MGASFEANSVPGNDHRIETFADPVDGTVWSIDMAFLSSNWACIWDQGCKGIGDVAAPELGHGCCSVGAQMLDADEGMRISALGAMLHPDRFEHFSEAREAVLTEDRSATRVVDGACIFLNRPGFAGGPGCALHIGALVDGDDPIDAKPSICWQLPLKVDRDEDGAATLRRWSRADWGAEGSTMAWCCTDEPEPYAGETPVVISLASQIKALVGPDVWSEIERQTR